MIPILNWLSPIGIAFGTADSRAQWERPRTKVVHRGGGCNPVLRKRLFIASREIPCRLAWCFPYSRYGSRPIGATYLGCRLRQDAASNLGDGAAHHAVAIVGNRQSCEQWTEADSSKEQIVMLVLSRRAGESIIIADSITVTILEVAVIGKARHNRSGGNSHPSGRSPREDQSQPTRRSLRRDSLELGDVVAIFGLAGRTLTAAGGGGAAFSSG